MIQADKDETYKDIAVRNKGVELLPTSKAVGE
jgi:hypothetical protein